MNGEEIRKLLEKYYNAETSEKEEIELRRFLSGDDFPDDLREERAIFQGFDQLSGIKGPSDDLEKKIMDSIRHDGGESKRPRTRRIYLTLSSIAAGLLVLTATYLFLTRESGPRDTYSDPEIAYAETMKILYDVSVKLNSGMEGLESVGRMEEITGKSLELINRPAEVIEKKLKPLDRFRKTMEVVNDMDRRR